MYIYIYVPSLWPILSETHVFFFLSSLRGHTSIAVHSSWRTLFHRSPMIALRHPHFAQDTEHAMPLHLLASKGSPVPVDTVTSTAILQADALLGSCGDCA